MALEYQKRAQSDVQTSTLKKSGTASIGFRESGFPAAVRGDPTTIAGGDLVVDTIVLTPDTLEVTGATYQLAAVAFEDDGDSLPDQAFTWASDDETVATVDANGLLTVVAVGTCNITASIDEVDSNACAVTVDAVFTGLALADATLTFAHTTTGTTTITAQDQFGTDMALPDDIVVASSDEGVATVELVTDTITVTGVSAGTTDVTASLDGITSNTCAVTCS
jgi:uncharacterized protein YjdB